MIKIVSMLKLDDSLEEFGSTSVFHEETRCLLASIDQFGKLIKTNSPLALYSDKYLDDPDFGEIARKKVKEAIGIGEELEALLGRSEKKAEITESKKRQEAKEKRSKIKNIIIVTIVLALMTPLFIHIAPFIIGGRYSFIALSSSMDPIIPIGSIVIIDDAKAQEVKVDEVITFKLGEVNVIHRVVEITKEDGKLYFKTKGDANQSPDPWLVGEDQIMGKLLLVMPFYGYIIQFGRTSLGFLSLVIIPITLPIIIEVWRILRKAKLVEHSG